MVTAPSPVIITLIITIITITLAISIILLPPTHTMIIALSTAIAASISHYRPGL